MSARGKARDYADTAPTRCPRCQGRMLQERRLMNTFEEWQLLGWQCVGCGITMERDARGGIVLGRVRPVVLAPGELAELRAESSVRTDPKNATRKKP